MFSTIYRKRFFKILYKLIHLIKIENITVPNYIKGFLIRQNLTKINTAFNLSLN